MEKINAQELAGKIDHTLLKPEASLEQIRQLCDEARHYGFASVCVSPYYVAAAKKYLQAARVAVCTVIGFPLGANTTAVKILEAQQAVAHGADELDMVISIAALKNRDEAQVAREISALRKVCAKQILKVIIETAVLTNAEKIKACELAQAAGADFVKTSTGFASAGATVEDVQLMRATVGPTMGIKASGGIRTLASTLQLLQAGATRIGASQSLQILQEIK